MLLTQTQVESTRYQVPFKDVFSGSVHADIADTDELSTTDDALDASPEMLESPEVHLIPTTTWEGYVTWVSDDRRSFCADLRDKQRILEPHTVEIDIESVLKEDHSLVVEGAVFYWIIGRAIHRGQHFNFDDIRFRRLPNWTEERIARATAKADAMFDFLQSTPLTE